MDVSRDFWILAYQCPCTFCWFGQSLCPPPVPPPPFVTVKYWVNALPPVSCSTALTGFFPIVALDGTAKVVLKAPLLSAVGRATTFPSKESSTTAPAGHPLPLAVTFVP